MKRANSNLMQTVLLALLMLLPSYGALARPFRGSDAWSVILCRFKGYDDDPGGASFYRRMYFGAGGGGMSDYWKDTAYGGLDFKGSIVKGWYDQPFTVEEAEQRSRAQRYQDCLEAARTSPVDPFVPPAGHKVVVITYPEIDNFDIPGVGTYLPYVTQVAGMSHLVARHLGLETSYSDDTQARDGGTGRPGESDDPWDLMSYPNTWTAPTDQFGRGGPGLNAFNLDRMGWLPKNRIVTFGADGRKRGSVVLAALNHPEASGALQLRIPFDPEDPFRYYMVEYRVRGGWDAGIPGYEGEVVLIHEIKRDQDGIYRSYLKRSGVVERDPVQDFDGNGVSIRVVATDPEKFQATVFITSQMPERCLPGFVWREANALDRVCVTPETRAQTQEDNAKAHERVDRENGSPDACLPGYVWRWAYSGDFVCVTPATRDRAEADNAQAESRRNPARLVLGPNACKPGFVWREADDRDYVCVTPETRAQALDDNARAAERRSPVGGPAGPDTCLPAYVWRDAFPGDHVCVTPQTRASVQADNAAAGERLLVP